MKQFLKEKESKKIKSLRKSNYSKLLNIDYEPSKIISIPVVKSPGEGLMTPDSTQIKKPFDILGQSKTLFELKSINLDSPKLTESEIMTEENIPLKESQISKEDNFRKYSSIFKSYQIPNTTIQNLNENRLSIKSRRKKKDSNLKFLKSRSPSHEEDKNLSNVIKNPSRSKTNGKKDKKRVKSNIKFSLSDMNSLFKNFKFSKNKRRDTIDTSTPRKKLENNPILDNL